MITAKFILNNYVKPVFLKTGNKSGNASCFYKNGEKYIITRETDYVYSKRPDGKMEMFCENDGTNIIHTHNSVYEKENNELKFIKRITKAEGNDWGFEDPRTAYWNNKNYVIFSKRMSNRGYSFSINYGIIDDDFNYIENKTVKNIIRDEKNWAPIEDMPGYCIHTISPFTLFNLFDNTPKQKQININLNLRGSSNIIKYKDNYVGIYHIRNEAFEYLHYIVLFDNKFNVIQVSDPFSFFGTNVEFNCSLEFVNGTFNILVAVHDQILYEFSITENVFNDIMKKTFNNVSKDNEIYTKFYYDALSNNNIFTALGLSVFSLNKDVIKDAISINHNKNYFRNPNNQKWIQQLLLENYKK